MDSNLILTFRQSNIIKGILVFLFVLYIGLFLLLNSFPKGTLVIPADMVEDGIVFYQPVDIVVLDSFTIISNGITIDRYQIQTPGSYSFQLSQPNLESGFNQTVSFKVVIYNTDTAYLLLFFSIVPMVLFLLSLRRAHHDIIQ